MAVDRLSSTPRRILGVGMVGLVVAVLALCISVYNKVFTAMVPVTMVVARADNSFLPEAEIRLRGITVGRVSATASNGHDAILSLQLQPDQVKWIPRNVTAQILPKSLFGEGFVSLDVPSNPSPQRIQAGDVIGPDRTGTAIEVGQVFTDLLPVLQAVQPAELASTLGAVNQALTGRGVELGDTISRLHDYLSKFNPALPDLTKDIAALPQFTDTYTNAAPNLIEGLKDLTTTSRTLVQERGQFEDLFTTVTGTANDLRGFVDENGDNFIDLVSTVRPTLDLLARYAPQSVCFFRRLADAIPRADRAFSKGKERNELNITLEIVVNRGKFLPHRDEPDITDNRGPRCYDNTPPLEQYPGGPAQDGSTHPPASKQRFALGKRTGTEFSGDSGSGSASSSRSVKSQKPPLLGGQG